jgi:hypothetical protein
MIIKTFNEEIKALYHKYFPESEVIAKLDKNLYRCIDVRCFLSKNEEECINNIRLNDMFRVSFTIDQNGLEFDKNINELSNIPDVLTLNVNYKTYVTIPDSQYLAYGSRSLNFRKVTSDYTKILAALDKYFHNLKLQLIKDLNAGQIHKNHIEILKHKLNVK